MNPPLEYQPFARWWWNGSRVSSEETLKQLDQMLAGGIGGVEINTIGVAENLKGDPRLDGYPALEWLGPEWTQVVLDTVAGIRARGMTADIIVGSGWPFGGQFLELKEQSQRMRLVKLPLRGPMRFEESIKTVWEDSLLTGVNRTKNRDLVEPNLLKLGFLRLVDLNHGQSGFEPGIDLLPGQADEEQIIAEIPEGEHMLYVGFHEVGYTVVKQGAPGADGPVVDHYNAEAVRRYLDLMSSRFEEASGERMGDLFRATFVDSLELDHSNWTWDVPEVFEERRGYSVWPYLPFVLDHDQPAMPPGREFQDTVRRVRYDFVKTLINLFEERFMKTYVAWAEENGMQARIQGYGRETHPLHGAMVPHLPEGETWLWHDSDTNRGVWEQSTVVNKFASSGAHLSGKRVVSFEAMTNAVPVFRATLDNFKRAMDLSLLDGLNHPILHGWNYFPEEAEFPGWIRFGSYVNPTNPFWSEFASFSNYVGRMGVFSRNGEYQAQVALLAPRSEEWARDGMLYQPFPEIIDPWYQYMMAGALQKVGFGVDYVSERILQNASFEDGSLVYGERAYPVLVVQDVEAMEPETAQAIQRFSEAGGKLVFIGDIPHSYPGYFEQNKNDEAVSVAMARLDSSRVLELISPKKEHGVIIPGPRGKFVDDSSLIGYAEQIRRFSEMELPVRILNPNPHVSQVHYKMGDGRDAVLMFNLNRQDAMGIELDFRDSDMESPRIWNPLTGGQYTFELDPGNRGTLLLQPLESRVLVFNSASYLKPAKNRWGWDSLGISPISEEPLLKLEGEWSAVLQPTLPSEGKMTFESFPPGDISLMDPPALARFGGIVEYRTTFSGETLGENKRLVLDLGEVNGTTAITLNGEALEARWYGRHMFDVTDFVQPGENELEVRVTTVLANVMKYLEQNSERRRCSWWFDPIPMGMMENPAIYEIPTEEL